MLLQNFDINIIGDVLRVHMAYATIAQNVGGMVDPEFLFAQVMNGGDLKLLAVLRHEVLNLSIVIFDNLVKSLGNNGSGVYDTGNLGSKVVLLSSEEEGVGEDGSLKISSEEDLDLPRGLNICGGKIWELDPLIKDVVGDKVGELINTSALGLLVSGTALALTTFLATLDDTLSNIIIFLGSSDLSE